MPYFVIRPLTGCWALFEEVIALARKNDLISDEHFSVDSFIGQYIHRHTNLTREINTQVPLRHGIRHSDVIKSYLAMVCLGKNDFEAINTIESQYYFMTAMDVDDILSEATLRQPGTSGQSLSADR